MKNYLINKKERLKGHFSTSKNWVEKNDKYLSPAFFIAGFILDNLTLTRIDMFFDNAILFGYLSLVAFSIIMMRAVKREGIVKYLPFVLQFAFGGLFSGYVIFYTKSASLASSWIFLFLLYGLFLGNERLRHYYKKSDLIYRAIADCKKDPIKGYLAVQALPQLEDQSREMQNYLTDLLK